MSNVHSLYKNSKFVKYNPPFNSFDQFLEKLALKHNGKAAIVFEDIDRSESFSISYSELNKLSKNIANSLLDLRKLKVGDSFSYSLTNTPEIILLNFAAWRAGLVSVPLDPRRDILERKIYKLKLTNSKLLFTHSDSGSRKENLKLKKALANLNIIELKNFEDFKKRLTNKDHKKIKLDMEPSDLNKDCLILFTSGTTANPKGIRLNLKCLFANAESVADWLEFDQNERFYIFLPLHHINATTFVNATFVSGGTLILSSRYSKTNFWSIIARHKATGSSIVPTIAYDLLSEEKSFKNYESNLQKVKRIQIGSAPVQPLIVEKFMQKFKIPLYQGYGQTETSLRSTGVPMNLTKGKYSEIRKINSLGSELKFTNVTVLNKNNKECKEGEVGEICVRGPIIMPGYLKDEKETMEAFAGGWFHSGDMGYFSRIVNRKFFFMTGRTKEIIKKGGYLISPLAIENTLLTNYPSLEMVYAVGFPEERIGEEIGIVCVTKDDSLVEKILNDGKKGRIKGLPLYESPTAAIRVKEKDLPKTSTGKVQRTKIKEIYKDALAKNFRTIVRGENTTLRFIKDDEHSILKEAVRINNQRWEIKSTYEEFKKRAKNGLLIGAFNSNGKLVGSISAIQLDRNVVMKIGTKNHFANSWVGITGGGTLSTNNPKGDSLVCISVSAIKTKVPSKKQSKTLPSKKKLSPKELNNYLKSDKDSVISFHKKAKGGLERGAKIIKVIENGRPEDRQALGFNILMQYPTPKKPPKLNSNSSIGSQLIEAALIYAYQKGLKYVYTYTRPADIGKYFTTSF